MRSDQELSKIAREALKLKKRSIKMFSARLIGEDHEYSLDKTEREAMGYLLRPNLTDKEFKLLIEYNEDLSNPVLSDFVNGMLYYARERVADVAIERYINAPELIKLN